MKKIYFYPCERKVIFSAWNPYTFNFQQALQKFCEIVNFDHPISFCNSFDILKYSFKADTYILNWPENIPHFRFGKIQTLILVTALFLIKIRKAQIVWILHNIQPHKGENIQTAWIKKILFNQSHLIITHSNEALEYIKGKSHSKIFFAHHPIKLPIEYKKEEEYSLKIEIDILIWGNIVPYKGIVEFLTYLHSSKLHKKHSIRIIGKCKDTSLKKEIEKYCNDKIFFENRILPFDELAKIIPHSRYVLFPYVGNSISSSGALIDTLILGGNPIGPAKGAFIDLDKENVCFVYRNYAELLEIINQDRYISKIDREAFIHTNTWESFVEKLIRSL